MGYCNGNVLTPSYIAFKMTFSYNKFADLPQGKCYLIVAMENGSIINYRMVGKHLLLIYLFFREVGFHFKICSLHQQSNYVKCFF